MNVRVFPYSPLRNEQKFSALVVWDSLSQIESGGRVDHYFVSITDAATGQLPALAQFVSYSASSLPSPLLYSPSLNIVAGFCMHELLGSVQITIAFMYYKMSFDLCPTIIYGYRGIWYPLSVCDPLFYR